MIKIEYTDVYGLEASIRGMRNPLNSWEKSDSSFEVYDSDESSFWTPNNLEQKNNLININIGENDMKLMKQLRKAGSDHRKYLRMINVTCDITAPIYWWKEFDTYKVGTVANSCSTMHKIHDKEFTLNDFSNEHLTAGDCVVLEHTIDCLNKNRILFLREKDKSYWYSMIQLLPSSYNQKRTVQLNYEVLMNMYHARKNHKLDEWHTFCDWIETLPYGKELICIKEERK